jgi:hypothetical protein
MKGFTAREAAILNPHSILSLGKGGAKTNSTAEGRIQPSLCH